MEKISIEKRYDQLDALEMMAVPGVPECVQSFLVELKRAMTIHPVWPEGIVNQTAVMAGEAGEALKAANHYREGRKTEGNDSMLVLKSELVQTAAMCIRCLINLEKQN